MGVVQYKDLSFITHFIVLKRLIYIKTKTQIHFSDNSKNITEIV